MLHVLAVPFQIAFECTVLYAGTEKASIYDNYIFDKVGMEVSNNTQEDHIMRSLDHVQMQQTSTVWINSDCFSLNQGFVSTKFTPLFFKDSNDSTSFPIKSKLSINE